MPETIVTRPCTSGLLWWYEHEEFFDADEQRFYCPTCIDYMNGDCPACGADLIDPRSCDCGWPDENT